MQNQDTQFVIPIYQRNYDWTESHCQQLLDDIIDVGNRSKDESKMHFIGSIVYICNDEYTTEEIAKFVIIDGQQRLTTVTLLLLAIYHHALSLGEQQFAEKIWEYYIINKNAEYEEYKIKLKTTADNNNDLEKLLRDEPQQSINKFSNIRNNYNFFRNKLKENDFNVIYEGFRRLLFVEIKLERGKDNAQKIFESLNSTGLDLSQADLIRNYVLMELEPTEQTRLYKKYWANIEQNTQLNAVSYMSDFIRDYLTLTKGDIPNKNTVYSAFKKLYRIEEIGSMEHILENMLRYSFVYRALIAPEQYNDNEISRELKYINYIEINVSYPFLMQVMDDYNNGIISKETLINILQFVQTYSCRRFILDLPTNSLNKIFMNLYKQIDKSDYEQSLYRHIMTRTGKVRIPSDFEIENSLINKDLYNAKSKMKLYILERLENFENKEIVTIIDNPDITIEHIFPQNPDPRWKQQLNSSEYDEFSNIHLHTIGNLTLSGNNGALGNKHFVEKKEMNNDNKEQGYKYSRLWLNRYLNEIDTWNIEKYQERSKLMFLRFKKVWKLPEVSGIEEAPELNIFDIDDPTGKHIEYAIFFGKQLSGNEYKGIKLYTYLIDELYKLQPDIFLTDFFDLLRLKEDSQELIRCQKLNSTYYYDTNLSYMQMFSNLKRILSKMEITDELYIKFRNTETANNQDQPTLF